MPIVYQYHIPDYGWVTTDLDGIVEEFRNEIEANTWPKAEPGEMDEITFKVRIVSMTQDEIDAMPEAEI